MKQLFTFLGIITFINFLIPAVIYSKINRVFNEHLGASYVVVMLPNFLFISLHGCVTLCLVAKRYFFNNLENHNAIYKFFSISNCILNYLWLFYINSGHAYKFTSYMIIVIYFVFDFYISYRSFVDSNT